jgi:hypothetical protein
MDLADAFEIVLEQARQNVADAADMPGEHARQIHAINWSKISPSISLATIERKTDLQFRLNITCDNVAFANDRLHEVTRILREVANRLDYSTSPVDQTLRDINGNEVGRFVLAEQPKLFAVIDLCIDEPNSMGLSLHQTEKSAKTRVDKLALEDLEQLENIT